MLSYRHAFHAGNLADVLKHTVLCTVLSAATRKDTPLFYLDTHAGAGHFRFDHDVDAQTEYRAGIGALWDLPRAAMPAAVAAYLAHVAEHNPRGSASSGDARSAQRAALSGARSAQKTALSGASSAQDTELTRYPGSPLLAARLLRPQDRLRLCELHPKDHPLLVRAFADDRRVVVSRQDGYAALAAELPPQERRGVVFIDPSYELADEGHRVLAGLERGLSRFRHGTFIVWLPRAGKLDVPQFESRFVKLAPPKTLALTLDPGGALQPGAIASAVWILNPPFSAVEALESALAYLGKTLTPSGDAHARWLVS